MTPENRQSSAIPENVPAPEAPADLANVPVNGSKILSMFGQAAKVRHALADEELRTTAYQRN